MEPYGRLSESHLKTGVWRLKSMPVTSHVSLSFNNDLLLIFFDDDDNKLVSCRYQNL